MPESYVGESLYLRDTMEDWMLTANWTWYTERIMPWYRTDNIHVQWTEWENNVHYMGITPHQAMSNVVTQKRTIRKADMVRRGIAAEFENDFIGTALGRTSFMASLGQMARSVQETANVEVLRALLGCHRFQQTYIRKHGIVKEGELDLWWQRKAERFMICQKGDTGMEHLNTFVDQDMEQFGGKANVWILGREIMDYCDLVPPGKIYYAWGGQEAVDRLNGRPQNGQAAAGTQGNIKAIQPTRLVADTPVFIAKSRSVDSVGQADLLSRTTEIGSFNTMIDKTTDFKAYKTENRTIRVYDNDRDDWAEITLEDAIENCLMFEGDKDIHDPFKSNKMRGGDVGRADLANDFLRHGTEDSAVGQDVVYFGDLGSKWLDVRQILGAGQTLLNQLADFPLTGIAVQGVTQAQADSNAKRAVIQEGLKLAGESNLFRKNVNGVELNEGTLSTTLAQYFGGAGNIVTLAAPIGSSASVSTVTPEQAEEKYQAFMRVTLGSVLPASFKPQLDIIANNTAIPWQERVASVEALVLKAFQEEPESFSSLKSAPQIKTWVKSRTGGFNKEFNEWAATQVSSSVDVDAATEEKFIPAGKPIPEGYRVVRSVNGKEFPSSLSELTNVSHLFEGGEEIASGGIGRRPLGRIGGAADRPRTAQRGVAESGEEAKLRLANKFKNMDYYVKKIQGSNVSSVQKWMSLIWLGSTFNKETMLALAGLNVWVPFNALFVRAHQTFRTRYGIKCADAGNTGYTFIGHTNMQIEHEAARKVGMMHYTAYLSAVVMSPKNVYVCEDIYCEKYLGGRGTKFWGLNEYLSKGANRRKKSIICTLLPPKCQQLDKKIDIRGYWYTEQRMGLVDEQRFSEVCYPGIFTLFFKKKVKSNLYKI